jgi:LysW-gamma-L-lysine carboxypeptidase
MSSSRTLNDDERFLFELVSTASVSGNERRASEAFVRRASELGFDAHIDEVDNAIAHRGPEDAPVHIVLLGHIDTVPGDIPVRVEDGVLHGRGSVDAKGPLCAMLAGAARAELPDGVRVSVIGAVGEEAPGSIGANHIVHRMRPDACIIGEPSGWDGVTLGYKGRLLATARARCANHHSAGEDLSAPDRVHVWWSRVLEFVGVFNGDRERAFDRIQATILGTQSESDGLTQSAMIRAGFRLPLGADPDVLADELSALGDEGIMFEFEGRERAHATDRNDPVVRALSVAIREHGATPRPKLKTGTADLNVVGPVWDCPIAAYGPGDSSLDHTPEERLSLDEYARSIRVLTSAIESLASELVESRSVVQS